MMHVSGSGWLSTPLATPHVLYMLCPAWINGCLAGKELFALVAQLVAQLE